MTTGRMSALRILPCKGPWAGDEGEVISGVVGERAVWRGLDRRRTQVVRSGRRRSHLAGLDRALSGRLA